jgi:acyl-CoA thioester hydrolase
VLLYTATVRPEWIDYNGHMTEACYVLVFGYTTDALMRHVGMDEDHQRRTDCSLYTVEAHIAYLHEVGEGEALEVTSRLLDLDAKRVHAFHTMHGAGGRAVATAELMLLHVDRSGPRATPLPAEVHRRLEALREAQAHLPQPEGAGRSIGIRR